MTKVHGQASVAAGDDAGPAWLIDGGHARQRRGGCEVMPWRDLSEVDILDRLTGSA